jgi:hypothetical protein
VKLSDLGLSGTLPVRDLWRHASLPAAKDTLSATVPRHGVVFVKVGTPKSGK